MTLARPYPARIAELERELDELRRERKQAREDGKLLWLHGRNETKRADAAERDLATTRQQYVDADDAWRKLHEQRKRLFSEIDRLNTEVATLRFDETQLLAENANLILANDHLKRDKADLHQQLAVLRDNAKQQADVIRAQEAEIERLRGTLRKVKPGVMLIAYEDGDHQRLVRAAAKHQRRADAAEAELERLREREPTGQNDLPPTRAEERAKPKTYFGDVDSVFANRIATDANEEREG